jgi:hypothetical protein
MPLDEESVAEVRKVEVAVQFGGGPDLPGFDASMIGRRLQQVVRLIRISILEEQLEIFQESRPVAFNGEQKVGVTVSDQILGRGALGEQGVGGDVFSLDVDGLQHRDGHLGLVGTFDFFFVLYGQSANFLGCCNSASGDRRG